MTMRLRKGERRSATGGEHNGDDVVALLRLVTRAALAGVPVVEQARRTRS